MDSFYASDKRIIESACNNSRTNNSSEESKMEVVKMFNSELVSLYDIKPPISKAKMTAITKAAMKSVKFYKHVVHGVEKFILKCRPDYKIPGLYVIDSIVRQSRHQFGVEKDVFAPRFSKNLLQTFKNICLCPEEDKQKLVRVINLWQKHKVFPDELLKKFLVMAEASEEDLPELYKDEIEAIQRSSKKSPTSGKKKKKSPSRSGFDLIATPLQPNSYHTNSSASRTSSTFNDTSKNNSDIIQQLQTLTTLLQQSNVPPVNASPVASIVSNSDQVKFDKKLLDYDYGDDEDENVNFPLSTNTAAPNSDSITSILTNPDVLRQLQTLQVQLSMTQAKQQDSQAQSMMDQQRMTVNQQMPIYNPSNPSLMQQQQYQSDLNFANAAAAAAVVAMQNMVANQYNVLTTIDDDGDDKPEIIMEKHGSDPLEVIDLDRIPTPQSDTSGRQSYSRSKSRSNSRSPRGRSRRPRSRRSRSHSWIRERSRDRERNNDRRRRALPPIKRKHLAVCSTTLWVGHLSKLVQEQDLSDTFGEFGDIVSIDLIPPRGCAFLCMNRRQDADRALHKLKNTKIHGKAITIAWAPGKGMKGREWKDYWEVDYGVSYVPWSKLTKETDLELLEEGGMLDQETMPDWLKDHLEEKRRKPDNINAPKAIYSPTGTDMDESDNDDNTMDMHHPDVIIETSSNGMAEQMIPLPDGPQPNVELQAPLGIPMPPNQNPLPPPNLLNPFNLPPRLLAPVGGLGTNFIPSLGVPPPSLLMSQPMVNRLPPPFSGPPSLPMMNSGPPGSNPSLAQLPIPDSADSSRPANKFKPPHFGLNPNLLFPGPSNQDLVSSDVNADKNLFSAGPFKNLPLTFNPSDLSNLKQDFHNEDSDYRILGGLSTSGPLLLNDTNLTSKRITLPPLSHLPLPVTVKNLSATNDSGPSEELTSGLFNNDHYTNNEYNQEQYGSKFHERGRDFNKDSSGNSFQDRSHRFGSRRSPYKEDRFEIDCRNGYRQGRYNRDLNRNYKKGGLGGPGPSNCDTRDFCGTNQRQDLPGLSSGSRSHPRSRDRDSMWDLNQDHHSNASRQDYIESEHNRRRNLYSRPYKKVEDKFAEDTFHGAKRSRWSNSNPKTQPPVLLEPKNLVPLTKASIPSHQNEPIKNETMLCTQTNYSEAMSENSCLETKTTIIPNQFTEYIEASQQTLLVVENESKINNDATNNDPTLYNEINLPEDKTKLSLNSCDQNQAESSELIQTRATESIELVPTIKSSETPSSISTDQTLLTIEASQSPSTVESSRLSSSAREEMNKMADSNFMCQYLGEVRNDGMNVEKSGNNPPTELRELVPLTADKITNVVSETSTITLPTTQAVIVSEAIPIKLPTKKSSTTFDMFADDDDEEPTMVRTTAASNLCEIMQQPT